MTPKCKHTEQIWYFPFSRILQVNSRLELVMYSRSNIGAIYATDPENKATNHFLYETCNALIKLKKSTVRRHKILHVLRV